MIKYEQPEGGVVINGVKFMYSGCFVEVQPRRIRYVDMMSGSRLRVVEGSLSYSIILNFTIPEYLKPLSDLFQLDRDSEDPTQFVFTSGDMTGMKYTGSIDSVEMRGLFGQGDCIQLKTTCYSSPENDLVFEDKVKPPKKRNRRKATPPNEKANKMLSEVNNYGVTPENLTPEQEEVINSFVESWKDSSRTGSRVKNKTTTSSSTTTGKKQKSIPKPKTQTRDLDF